MNSLEVNNLKFLIKDKVILKNISFNVKAGEIFGIIGHNGSGKTSLLRIILGLCTKYQGAISIMGSDDLSKQRMNIGSVMDSTGMEESVSASKYIHKICYMFGTDGKVFERELLEKTGLSFDDKKPIHTYSLGMKRRLKIAVALANNPKILVMDEPFNGIDPNGMVDMRFILQQLSCNGITVIVTSHIISELIKLASVFGVLYEGDFLGSYSHKELKDLNLRKYIINVSEPVKFIESMKELYPEYLYLLDSTDQVFIIGNMDTDFIKNVQSSFGEIRTFINKTAQEEEILLWKMNGYK